MGNDEFVSILAWGGAKPDRIQSRANLSTLLKVVRDQAQKFSTQYPSEKTLQVSLEHNLPYQSLIWTMDGAREVFPDIVLVSYHEADAR